MRISIWVVLMLAVACTPPRGNDDCAISWTGGATGTADCDGTGDQEILALGDAPPYLVWSASGENSSHRLSFQFLVPNPPDESSYTGGAAEEQSCLVTLVAEGAGPSYSALSRANPSTGATAHGSCGITFTRKTDRSDNTTTVYDVDGTATATLEGPGGASDTVEVTVEF